MAKTTKELNSIKTILDAREDAILAADRKHAKRIRQGIPVTTHLLYLLVILLILVLTMTMIIKMNTGRDELSKPLTVQETPKTPLPVIHYNTPTNTKTIIKEQIQYKNEINCTRLDWTNKWGTPKTSLIC